MPYSELSFWHELGKWIAGIFATASAFFAMVNKWHGSRFKKLNDRVDKQDIVIDEHDKELSEHSSQLAVLSVHVENGTEQRDKIEKSIERLHDKLDKVISG